MARHEDFARASTAWARKSVAPILRMCLKFQTVEWGGFEEEKKGKTLYFLLPSKGATSMRFLNLGIAKKGGFDLCQDLLMDLIL